MRSILLLFFIITTVGANYVLSAQTRCGILRGRVVDASGSPVDRARVGALAMDHPPNMQSARLYTETDQKGEFSLSCLEPGMNGVYVSKEADYYPNTMFSVFPDKNTRWIVHIAEGQAISGFEIRLGEKATKVVWRVVDWGSGNRIDIATTLNICERKEPHNCRRITIVDSGQGYSFFLPSIDFVVRASARGYSETKPLLLSLKPASTRTVTIPLKVIRRL